jgi:zinc protease
MIDRSIAPHTQGVSHITIPPVVYITLDNGIPLYVVAAGEQPVVKLDFVFESGKWYEPKNLLADFTNRLVREGTRSHSAMEIADSFEYYGCNLESSVSFTHAGFQLYSLSQHLLEVLPMMRELLTEASFPQQELDTVLHNRRQKHTERLAKNDYVANRLFLSNMWGATHPYGRVTEMADFEGVHPAMLLDFYQQYYQGGSCFIIAAGQVDDAAIKRINELFGAKDWVRAARTDMPTHIISPAKELRIHLDKTESVQSAVMVGQATITRSHPDYEPLTILNTVLGGYFGSRLMANIREEKGYTYGIYSSLSSYQHGGIFEISAEVGKEVREDTLLEIKKELNTLCEQPIDAEELTIVKNYMAGRILRSIDGPMKYADVLKGQILYGKKPETLNGYLQTIQAVTSIELQALAVKYLDYDKMYKVSVG